MRKQTHILITRLSAMGDVAMTVPVVHALAKAYPEIQISFLSKPFHRPIVEAIPNVQFVAAQVKTRHKGISGMWKLASQLNKREVTHVADLHNVIRTKMLTKFLGLPTIKIDKGRAEKKALTREKDKQFKPLKTTVQRYVDVLEFLGYAGIVPLTLPVPDKTGAIREFTFGCGKKWLGIAPFAAHQGKQYPLDLMQKVLQMLDARGVFDIFLFGSPDEVDSLKDLSKNCQNTKIVASQVSFSEEINLIAQLDVMLSMDSGNGHLAAMYGVPTVTLWGVTHPYAGFAPFKQESNCLISDVQKFPLIPTSVYGNIVPDGYEHVMRSINPDVVVNKIVEIIF